MARSRIGAIIILTGVSLAAPAEPAEEPRPAPRREPTGKAWIDMDYGPFLTASLEVWKGNIARKGIAIRLDDGEGGISSGREFILFDTDTLSCAAGWAGPEFINWTNIAFDGSHQTHPSIRGELVFGNPAGPGWGRPGDGAFEDPRPAGRDGLPYGPLPRDWGRWKGLYLHGRQVVLSYTAGGVDVLESPGAEGEADRRAWTRTIQLGPRARDMALQVAFQADGKPVVRETAVERIAVLFGENPSRPRTIVRRIGGPPGASWIATDDGHLRLGIPAGRGPARLKLLFSGVPKGADLGSWLESLPPPSLPVDLAPLTRGGPPRWTAKLTTRAETIGKDDGPYAVDDLTLPMENPYRSWIRPGGFDFFEDGGRAALSTWMGDVWVVGGLGGTDGSLVWTRIATGLFQPLGLRILDGRIFVLGRDQITRLHDLNGDGETDFYECFNNDHQVTEHFHEFAMDLQTDSAGNFYYAKGARHALDWVVPHHGTILKVARDGSRTEIVAHGFRAPNGIWIEPDGSIITSDQEGHWVPANKIQRVRQGRFYGNMWSHHADPAPASHEPPICWLHPQFDRSPAEQLRVKGEKWGPLEGSLLSLSYGTGFVYQVLIENVDGVEQGGAVKMPVEIFPTGILRGRFHEGDGQLYLCGLFGWSSDRTLPGGFYRVRRTGRPLQIPLELHATKSGIAIRFSDPLDPVRARDPGSYAVERWSYRPTADYGSKDYRLSDGAIGRDRVPVKAAKLSVDGRSVFLEVADMRPCMQMRIQYRLRAADGSRLSREIQNTIHVLGDDGPYRKGFE